MLESPSGIFWIPGDVSEELGNMLLEEGEGTVCRGRQRSLECKYLLRSGEQEFERIGELT